MKVLKFAYPEGYIFYLGKKNNQMRSPKEAEVHLYQLRFFLKKVVLGRTFGGKVLIDQNPFERK